MPEFVGADADAAILRHRQIAENLGCIDRLGTAFDRPFVRPDITGVGIGFSTRAGVDDDRPSPEVGGGGAAPRRGLASARRMKPAGAEAKAPEVAAGDAERLERSLPAGGRSGW